MSTCLAFPIVHGFPGKSASHGAFGWSSLWLLRQAERHILIDAGHPAYVPLIHERLAILGLTALDITDIALTHLHWDHVANITMFPNATIWVGERELSWAAQQPPGTPFIPDLHVQELLRRRDGVERIAPDQEFLPGIHAIASGGHTPHHLAYFAERTAQKLLFGGDSVKNAFELHSGIVDSTLDRDASTRSIQRLRSLLTDTAGVLVPGHDVELRLQPGTVERIRAQEAQIGFFADPLSGESDRSISQQKENR
ncbi:MAG: MBL fold metallo-hydrolase [Beutenbergiaceae bacterium]